jgi:hypothetical protein
MRSGAKQSLYSTRSDTDCFSEWKNGMCPFSEEGASTAGISWLLALLLGGAAFLFRQAAGEMMVAGTFPRIVS